MTKPVLIEYTKGDLKGATYVVTSAAKAASEHPDAKIVSYEDGSPYEPPASKSADEPAKADKSK